MVVLLSFLKRRSLTKTPTKRQKVSEERTKVDSRATIDEKSSAAVGESSVGKLRRAPSVIGSSSVESHVRNDREEDGIRIRLICVYTLEFRGRVERRRRRIRRSDEEEYVETEETR